MKKLLNTLYVTTEGAYLAKDGETVAVRIAEETKLALPIHTLEGIVCFGPVTASPFLLGLCGERGVAVSFLNSHGRFLGRVTGPVSGNVLLRRKQYRAADDEETATAIARNCVLGKVLNSRVVVQRDARERNGREGENGLGAAVKGLASVAERLQDAEGREQVRGLEGEAARGYFAVFNEMIHGDKEAFCFRERSRRPPLDNVNAVLSFLYTMLAHDVVGALESVGLDPQVGFLHVERPGRPSLALDLMEELRPVVADRLALTLINRRQLGAGDFEKSESGAVWLTDAGRKTVLTAWQSRKKEEVSHAMLGEKVEVGLLPYVQALLLARHLRGDLDEYPPIFWK